MKKNQNSFFKKKAQITLFIILGIVLLLSSGVYFYMTYKSKEQVTPEIKKTIIDNFVESCLRESGQSAILSVGDQGGYVEIPDTIKKDPSSYIKLGSNFAIVPYWYHEGKLRMPELEKIEADISLYVEKQLPTCLNNFSALQNRYQITELAPPKVTTTISDEVVLIQVNYPLDVFDYKNEQRRFETFSTSFDVRLKKALELAKEIMTYENSNAFLENITLDLMAINEDVPFSGMDFNCQKRRWYVKDIKSYLQQSLLANLPSLRFKNTDYTPFLNPEEDYGKQSFDDSYDYFHFFFETSKNYYPKFSASAVYYPEFGMNLVARPATSSGVLESQKIKGSSYINFLCFNTYHFTYDVFYPAMFIVQDKDAFKGAGYIFRFATPVIINHNSPNRLNAGLDEMFAFSTYDPNTCNQLGAKTYELSVTGYDGILFGVELKGVNLTYRCFNLECPLGTTGSVDGVYKLKTALPSACTNGYIKAHKDGYLDNEVQFVGDPSFSVPLTKLKKLNLNFKKSKENTLLVGDKIADDEHVVFYLSAHNTTFEQYGYFNSKTNNLTIDLIYDNANYKMDAMLIKDDKLVGGYQGDIYISFNSIEKASTATFKVVQRSYVPILDAEQFDLMNYLESNAYQSALQPEFS